MPFIVALSPTYKFPVKFSVPDENGDAQEHDFMAVFKRCTVDEATEYGKGTTVDLARHVLVDWDGVYATKDAPLVFSDENVARLLSIPQAAAGVARAFWASFQEASAKN
ncbi:phage tail assembly chaperone [Pandoraea commovens]|uniref:Phage tail assembly chaperone n=1 Tax=Pandoraea commovens TaxID=2508289 RepID=A0ABY5QJ71_9BURK|nr:phage tail assembly chaperone [Pandoraea commovens]UVA80467.1 phage tail assembly chaperone [Pandoraea commovens]